MTPDHEKLLTADELAFLSGMTANAIERIGAAGHPGCVAELGPTFPNGYRLPQAFGACFLAELRRRGWALSCSLAVARWLAAQSLDDLLDKLDDGRRFVLATWKPGTLESKYDRVWAGLTDEQIQTTLAKVMPSAVQNELSVMFVDLLCGWERLMARMAAMDEPPMYEPSEN